MIPHISNAVGHRPKIINATDPVIVRTPYDLNYACGFRIEDEDVVWTILFNRKRLPQIRQLQAEVRQTIASYAKTA